MQNDEFAYTGSDNLEVMTEAVNYNRFLVEAVTSRVSPTDRVLDFGAGSGTYADMMRERGVTPDCLEPDQTLQDSLRERGFNVIGESDLEQNDGVYDVIYTLNVLEHIKNDQEACDQLARLLRPGGLLVVYVPALEMLFSSMDVKVEHYRRYRRTQLERILRNSGLEVTESRYCDPIGVLATLAYKFGPSSDGDISRPALRLYDRAVFPVSQAMQPLTSKIIGKNVLTFATRPTAR